MDSKKTLKVAIVGNILEFYDFSIYGFLIPSISPLFFPSDVKIITYIVGFLIFAASFIIRPIGGLFWGFVANKFGRNIALSYSIALIAFSNLMISILPTYAIIGIFAPFLLAFLRLLQGFCMGGEFSGSLVFISENLKPDTQRKAFYTSLATSAGLLGWFLGAFICYISSALISNTSIAWRVPFMLGALAGIYGIYIRIKVKDTLEMESLRTRQRGLRYTFLDFSFVRQGIKKILILFGIGAFVGGYFYYFCIFQQVFLTQYISLSPGTVKLMSMFGIATYMVMLPLFGMVSNKNLVSLGIFSAISGICCSILCQFLLISGKIPLIFLSEFLALTCLAGFMSPASYLMTRIYNIDSRTYGTNFGYNAGICLFGGFAPVIALKIYYFTGNLFMPASFTTTCATMGLIAFLLIKHDKNINLLH